MKMIKKPFIFLTFIFLCINILLAPNAYAVSTSCSMCDIKDAINNMSDKVSELLTTIATQAAKTTGELIYQANPYTAETIALNKALSTTAADNVAKAAKQKSNATNAMTMLFMKPAVIAQIYSNYGNICGPDFSAEMGNQNCPQSRGIFSIRGPQQTRFDGNYDASLFFSNNNFAQGSPQDTEAKNFITFVSNSADPITSIDEATMRALKNANMLTNPKVARLRNTVRSYVAQMSVGIDNFYYLYALHRQVANLGIEAGLPVEQKNISPDELDKTMAKRRIEDPNWYQDMSKASPTVIARETLYLLAEMRYEMYRQQAVHERLLAAMSSMEMQLVDTRKLGVNNMVQGVRSLVPS